jgi:hypothetical protein
VQVENLAFESQATRALKLRQAPPWLDALAKCCLHLGGPTGRYRIDYDNAVSPCDISRPLRTHGRYHMGSTLTCMLQDRIAELTEEQRSKEAVGWKRL